MINFLRKLRRNNMNTKYFKYAIGEIVLVMIGILLALGINNWNEERKDQIIEDQILEDMLVSLKNDRYIFSMLETRLEEKDSAIQLLFDYREMGEIPGGASFGDLIGTARRSIIFTYDMSPYQALVALGINKMSDKKLLNAINKYYNQSLPRSVEFIVKIQSEYDPVSQSTEDEAVREGLLERKFRRDQAGRWSVYYQSNPNRLFDDPSFYQSMVIEFQYADQLLGRFRQLIQSNQTLIDFLED